MLILGFHCFGGAHDTSACLVQDGRIVAAAEEERFSRVKHDGSFPFRSIEYCLAEAGVSFSDVDLLAFPGTPYRTGQTSAHAEADVHFFRRLLRDGAITRRSLWHKRALDLLMRAFPAPNLGMREEARHGFAGMAKRYGTLPPVKFFDHHRAHAAAAFFTSGLASAAVVTIDGRGGNYSTVVWHGSGTDLYRLAAEPYTNSLGILYELCTEYLGLGALEAGKTMGLAPYGDPERAREALSRILDVEGPAPYRVVGRPDSSVLGFPSRATGTSIMDAEYTNFAAALQKGTERAIQRTVRLALDTTGERALCLGGGVMYNCTSNGALLANGAGQPIWIFPAAGDSGLSVGAALLAAAEARDVRFSVLQHAFLGPGYSEKEYSAAVAAEPRVVATRPASISRDAAERIAKGQILGWFQGRLELGPRALGNRSILADPRAVGNRDRVNRVKGRELWRPLAPVVLSERAIEYFDLTAPSPFMLFAAQVREGVRSRVPAIVHVDGSARPQTVTREQNVPMYDLLCEFDDITGVPVLLNTSFNEASEPIVCSPTDAIRTLLSTDLDALVLGSFVVTRCA